MDCWICGDPASTGEHKTKQSDLRAVLGCPTQAQPFYYHDEDTRNQPVRGYRADILKWETHLCPKCNNERTQPHDRAWETLSEFLRARRPPIKAGDFIRGDRVFPVDTTRQMRNVQLYFVKQMGCYIMDAKLKRNDFDLEFDMASLSRSILNGSINPYLYLKFGLYEEELTGNSNLLTAPPAAGKSCTFATWFYQVGELAVNVMYAVKGQRRQGLVGAWHPSSGSNRLLITKYP